MKISSSTSLDAITEEASQWFTLNRLGELNTEQREAFWRWLQASPAHVQEYLGVAETWGLLHRSDAMDSISVDNLLGAGTEASNVIALRERPARSRVALTRLLPKKALGGLLSLVVIGGTVIFAAAGLKFFDPGSTYSTARGEQRSVVLEDGSVVQLNTSSRIRVRFEKEHRVIDLEEGEAYFRVAHDTRRPFDVRTPTATVRAVGTAFNVYNRGDRVDVAVVEGRVRVTGVKVDAARPLYLGASESAELTRRAGVVRKGAASPEASTAWMQRRLNFSSARVDAVIAEFNRYNSERMRIDDPQLAALRISGTFDADDAETLIAYLQKVKGVQVSRDRDAVVLALRDAPSRQ